MILRIKVANKKLKVQKILAQIINQLIKNN
jgi:hypothetical protein